MMLTRASTVVLRNRRRYALRSRHAKLRRQSAPTVLQRYHTRSPMSHSSGHVKPRETEVKLAKTNASVDQLNCVSENPPTPRTSSRKAHTRSHSVQPQVCQDQIREIRPTSLDKDEKNQRCHELERSEKSNSNYHFLDNTEIASFHPLRLSACLPDLPNPPIVPANSSDNRVRKGKRRIFRQNFQRQYFSRENVMAEKANTICEDDHLSEHNNFYGHVVHQSLTPHPLDVISKPRNSRVEEKDTLSFVHSCVTSDVPVTESDDLAISTLSKQCAIFNTPKIFHLMLPVEHVSCKSSETNSPTYVVQTTTNLTVVSTPATHFL